MDKNLKMTPKLTKLAKGLRKNATQAEVMLWSRLRARQMEGVKFRRQQPLENFIVDFVSFEKTDLTEADLSGSNFYGAEFLDAVLVRTKLDGANVKMTKLAGNSKKQ